MTNSGVIDSSDTYVLAVASRIGIDPADWSGAHLPIKQIVYECFMSGWAPEGCAAKVNRLLAAADNGAR
jgi:hypothetical protein